MMHTFRLLAMAEEIATSGDLRVQRPNRDELLAIKAGTYPYEALLAKAKTWQSRLKSLFDQASLPERPDLEALEALLIRIRQQWYAQFYQDWSQAK
ncbi:MAG: hypothetical protein HC913_11860 [Microscillaceae bacterium]|nr:hypothetical protein [Microscillaceae bacterium]